MVDKPHPGVFISFEGPEGSGKSTQVRLLAERLRAFDFDVVQTREPGGTATGERIRSILLTESDKPISAETEALLMTAARAEHVHHVLRPALTSGRWIISDRYADSTYAYQGGGRGIPMPLLRAAQELATGNLSPDLTLLLDLPVSTGLSRRWRDASTTNRLDAEAIDFHERVRTMYHSLASSEPTRWVVIDADQRPDAVSDSIWRVVLERFGHSLSSRRKLVSGTSS